MTERDQGRGDGRDPIDEEAAWAEIVAGYGEEPADPPGVWPTGDRLDRREAVDRVPPAERGPHDDDGGAEEDGEGRVPPEGERAIPPEGGGRPEGDTLLKGGPELDPAVFNSPPQSFHTAGGPRDWEAAEDPDGDHFVPPEPPPLPETDLFTKLAWIAVLGGPLLLVATVLFRWDVTWWIATLGVGGFLGGFVALIGRLRDGDDDEWTDPGSGAVV